LVAAELTGRRCFAMEIDPAYCDVIRQRYAAFTADG
jgi:DNA modification methylase